MAHLTINAEGWVSLPHATAHDCATLAARIGLDPADVVGILMHGSPPGEHFIASCLYYLPVEFDDLFQIGSGVAA